MGDSLVFKQESEYYEHFYNELTPWVHYVPVRRNLGDLVELVKLMINDDENAKSISSNGQKYARENLAPHNILGYYLLLFQVSLFQIFLIYLLINFSDCEELSIIPNIMI